MGRIGIKAMRKDGKVEYKKCDIGYSVYGENGQFSASGWLTVHTDEVIEHRVIGDRRFNSIAEAEKHIVEKAKSYLDQLIDAGVYRPIR